MLLENYNAVIYGAGGSIAGAVAKEFGREGARVFMTGRTGEELEAGAEYITVESGSAGVAADATSRGMAKRQQKRTTAFLLTCPRGARMQGDQRRRSRFGERIHFNLVRDVEAEPLATTYL